MISFLIPVYNGEKYIRRCIESILTQKKQPIEVIVYDDGSTDNTLKILNEINKNDNRVKIFSRENKGLFWTRKDLLSKVHGDYFWFVDADDTISDNAVELVINTFKNNNYDVVFVDYYRIEKNTKRNLHQISDDYCGASDINKLLIDMVCNNRCNNVWNKVFRTNSIKSIDIVLSNTNTVSMGEDLLWSVFLIAQTHSVGFLNSPVYNYYILENSMSRSFSIKKYQDFFLVRNTVEEYLYNRGINCNDMKDFYIRIINDMVYRMYYYNAIQDVSQEELNTMIKMVVKEYANISNKISVPIHEIKVINRMILKEILNGNNSYNRIKIASFFLRIKQFFI